MGIGNIGDLLKAKDSVEEFVHAHPKLPAYAEAVHREGVRPGSVIEVKFTTPEGKALETNFIVKDSDLEFLELVRTVMDSVRPKEK